MSGEGCRRINMQPLKFLFFAIADLLRNPRARIFAQNIDSMDLQSSPG